MSVTGIQGQTLEVIVVGCNRLKDTEWISRQDPYVSIEYGSSKVVGSICIDGSTIPTFQEKFLITLVEGIRELNVSVWSSNTMTYDNLIGSGRVQLEKVLSEGFDDTAWTIQSKSGRYTGEVCLIMHYFNANNPMTDCAPSAPQYCAAPRPPQPQQVPLYYAPLYPPVHPPSPYPPQPAVAICPPAPLHPPVYPPSPYPPQPEAAPCPPAPLYPPVHPPSPYPPQPAAAYPLQPSMYPPTYPPQAYPPQPYPPQGYPPNPCQTYPLPY